MSYLVARFQRWHLEHLRSGAVEEQTYTHDPEMLRAMEQSPNTWTAVADGLPIASGGTLELWPGRHLAWAVLGDQARKNILAVSRTELEVVGRARGRIECTVRSDFVPGQQWAKLLGFRVESPCLEAFGPQGENHIGFVRINKEA